MNRRRVIGLVLLASMLSLFAVACSSSEEEDEIMLGGPITGTPATAQVLLWEAATRFENATSYQGRNESNNTTGTECTVQSHDFAWTDSAFWTSTVTDDSVPNEIYYIDGVVYDRYGTDSEWKVSRSVTSVEPREVAELISAALNRVANPHLLEDDRDFESGTVAVGGTLAAGMDLLEGQSSDTVVRAVIDGRTFDLLRLEYQTRLGDSICDITWEFSDYGAGYLPPAPDIAS